MDSFHTTKNLLNSELFQTEYISNQGQYDTSKVDSRNSQESLESQQNNSQVSQNNSDNSRQFSNISNNQSIDNSNETNTSNIYLGNNNQSQNDEEAKESNQTISNNDVSLNRQLSSEIRNLKQQIDEEYSNINLNVLVVGESGVGKTTFINTFLHHDKRFKFVSKESEDHDKIVVQTHVKKDGQKQFEISMIDTLGYGEKLGIKDWYKLIKQLIKKRVSSYEQMEQSLFSSEVYEKKTLYLQKQKRLKDKRVHCCLYFLSSPRIKDTDILYIQKLSKIVNLIPVIAKGDTLTKNETQDLKQQFNEICEANAIKIYDLELGLKNNNEYLNYIKNGPNSICPPFLIVSSEFQLEDSSNHIYYGRQYQWGTVNVSNPNHCDFKLLYNLLLGQITINLQECTESIYQNYQKRKEEKQDLVVAQQKKEQVKYITYVVGAFLAVAIGGGGYLYSKRVH